MKLEFICVSILQTGIIYQTYYKNISYYKNLSLFFRPYLEKKEKEKEKKKEEKKRKTKGEKEKKGKKEKNNQVSSCSPNVFFLTGDFFPSFESRTTLLISDSSAIS